MIKRLLNSFIFIMLCLSSSAQTQLFWGTPFFSTLLESDGETELMSSDYTFQLGAFETGFTPSFSNYVMWSSNWNVMDEAYIDETFMGVDSMLAITTSGLSLGNMADASFDFRSAQLYIWAYNKKGLSSTPNEWALMTNTSWLMPTTINPLGLPSDYRTDMANVVILGAVDRDEALVLPVIRSIGGNYIAPNQPFHMQLHSIPEPSTLCLTFVASLMMLRRKRVNI